MKAPPADFLKGAAFKKVASPARIELTASGLGNLRSIRLSYGDTPLSFYTVFSKSETKDCIARLFPA